MSNTLNKSAYCNIGMFAVVSFLQAVQLLILAAILAQFLPFKKTDFVNKIFPVYLPEVRPEHEMLLFRLFVLLAMGVMAIWVWRFRRRVEEEGLWRQFLPYAIATAVALFIQIFFVFKLLLMGAGWATLMFYISVIATMAAHIFWPECRAIAVRFFTWVQQHKVMPHAWGIDIAFIGLLIVCLWPADINYVLGRMFIRDQFYHLDGMFFSAAWGHLNNLLINKDIISSYSTGLPIIFANILNFFHQFDYPGVVSLIIAVCIVYFVGLYFFMATWLRSRLWAIIGTLLIIKLQMFHWGVAPLAWEFPTAIPLRRLPEILFLFTLWRYHDTRRQAWLLATIASAGLMVFWVVDAGIYVLGTFFIYLLLVRWQLIVVAIPSAIAVSLVLQALVQPQTVLTPSFWTNQFEIAGLFVQGWGALPITEALKEKQFFAMLIGVIIPLFYAGNLIFALKGWLKQRTSKDAIWIMVLVIYGLGLYHYYIHRSGLTSYYVVCLPAILLLCFWLKRFVEKYFPTRSRLISVAIAIAVCGALLTSFWFVWYPNVFNLARYDWKQEAAYYKTNFDFSADASMITSLTKTGSRVPVISSFETKILMQAKRAPFFYYTPMVESSLMDDPKPRLTYLHTHERYAKTTAQIKNLKPPYIFIEKRMLQPLNQPAFNALLESINAAYQPYQEGKYLVAYKRMSP